MTPSIEDQLTDRQRDVLRLHREGKNPTEIGKALGISSQGVHGHLGRLRNHGLIADDAPTAARTRSSSRRRVGQPAFDPARALDAVRATVRAQEEAILARQAEIDEQIAALQAERGELDSPLAELRRFYGEPPTVETIASEGAADDQAQGDAEASEAASPNGGGEPAPKRRSRAGKAETPAA